MAFQFNIGIDEKETTYLIFVHTHHYKELMVVYTLKLGVKNCSSLNAVFYKGVW